MKNVYLVNRKVFVWCNMRMEFIWMMIVMVGVFFGGFEGEGEDWNVSDVFRFG